MALDPELAEMLNMPVLLERKTGKDQYGNVTYSAAVELDGFVDSVKKVVGTPGSRDGISGLVEKVSVPLLVLGHDIIVIPRAGDRITVVTDGSLFDCDSVSLYYDDGEPHHYEVELNSRE